MRGGETTAVIATHSMGFVRRFCNRAVWLHRGEIMALGPAEDVVAAYEQHLSDGEQGLIREPRPIEMATREA